MRVVGTIILAFCLNWLSCQAAQAEKRVALVIGNSAYQGVTRLTNPANDAAAIANTLKSAGFDVVDLKQNLKSVEMRRTLRDFSDRVRDADMVVVYYAGHGIEIDGINYLVPVDAVLERDIDAYDEAVSLDRVLMVIEPARQLRLVILDACRDNPFSRVMKRTIASRAIGRGLAKIEPTSPNTLIAFAAKAGSTALDGDSRNSPFTEALIRHLPKPGLDLRKAFGFVRDDVLKATNSRQEPFIYGSLGGDDVPLVAAVPAPAPVADPDAKIRRDYELAERVGTREAWDFFLATYPDGFYAKLAIAQRNKLAAEEARLAAAEKARATAEEQKRLAAEGARAAEQRKAAQEAKAAEEARVAAERKKTIEDARLAEAEKVRATELAKAEQERIAALKRKEQEEARAAEAARVKAAAEAKAAEEARIAAEKQQAVAMPPESEKGTAAVDAPGAGTAKPDVGKPVGQLAALSPADQPPQKPSSSELPRLLQAELLRVGCSTSTASDDWSAAAQKALGLFNKNARTKFDVKVASVDALESVKAKSERVCPLVCDRGYKADGEKCIKVICGTGYELGKDNTCERVKARRLEKPVANLPPATEREAPAGTPTRTYAPMGAKGPHKMLDGEPPPGTLREGVRVVVPSSACPRGQMLELIGGNNRTGAPRQRRCIKA